MVLRRDQRRRRRHRPARLQQHLGGRGVTRFGRLRDVGGQLRHVEHEPGAPVLGQLGGDRGVDPAPPGRADVLVQGGPHDRVGELVPALGGPRDQPGPDQPVERGPHLRRRLPGQPLHQRQVPQREPAEHRHHLRQLDIPAGTAEQPPQQPGPRPGRHHRGPRPQPGPPAVDGDRLGVRVRLDHLVGEERVAVAGREDGLGEPVVGRGGQHGGDQRLRLVPVQWFQVEGGAPAVVRHPFQQPLDLVAVGGLRAQRHHREHRYVGQPRQQRDQRDRLPVGDVQVLHHEQRRPPGRQLPE